MKLDSLWSDLTSNIREKLYVLGADPRMEAVGRAMSNGDGDALENAVTAGLTAKARDKFGTTVLHLAAGTGNSRVARSMLDSGADVDARTLAGETPLMYAARAARAAVAQVLLDRGATVDAQNISGWTALYFCVQTYFSEYRVGAETDFVEVVRNLIAHGASVDASPTGGWEPPRGYARDIYDIDIRRLLDATSTKSLENMVSGGTNVGSHAALQDAVSTWARTYNRGVSQYLRGVGPVPH